VNIDLFSAEAAPARRQFLLRSGLGLAGTALAASAAAEGQAPATPPAPAGLATAPRSQAGVSPRLTVHAIDTYHGATAAGLRMELSRWDEARGAWQRLRSVEGVSGGRTAEPLLLGEDYRAGRYELLLHLGEYFQRLEAPLPQPSFLSVVPVRMSIRDATQRVHLAMLFSPWGYSFYRGS
jgi:Transthyretin-like protein